VWLEQGALHVWLFALVAAAFAPWCVQLFARAIERRVKSRTTDVIGQALAALAAHDATEKNAENRSKPQHVERVEGKDA
jgi:TRAP-type uncharacterized transport system fused permease subunit